MGVSFLRVPLVCGVKRTSKGKPLVVGPLEKKHTYNIPVEWLIYNTVLMVGGGWVQGIHLFFVCVCVAAVV